MKKTVPSSRFSVLSIAIIACVWQLATGNRQPTYAETASLEQVEKVFMEGRYEQAAQGAKELIESHSRRRDELYYLKGLSELKLNRFKDARESFNAVISRYTASNRIFGSYVGMGDSYSLEGNTDEAVKIYNDVLKKFPANRNIAAVHSRLRNCARPAPQVITPAPEKEPAGNFSVQAGYFKSRKNADKLSHKLASEGYSARVEIMTDSNEVFYRVKVGRYNSRSEAEAAAAALKRSGYGTKICADAG